MILDEKLILERIKELERKQQKSHNHRGALQLVIKELQFILEQGKKVEVTEFSNKVDEYDNSGENTRITFSLWLETKGYKIIKEI